MSILISFLGFVYIMLYTPLLDDLKDTNKNQETYDQCSDFD